MILLAVFSNNSTVIMQGIIAKMRQNQGRVKIYQIALQYMDNKKASEPQILFFVQNFLS